MSREFLIHNGKLTSDLDADGHLVKNLPGVAHLIDGKVPSDELPAYVDDVIEYATVSSFPATGERGKIYIALDTNRTYRWSGSQYTEIASTPTIDATVTKDSTNPVKSSGIWSAIWGSLASLPTGFTSLYDWCVSQLAGKMASSATGADIPVDATQGAQKINAALAGKLDKSGGAVTGPVLINSENASLVSPLTLGFNYNPEHIENTLDIIRAGNGDIYLRIYDTTLADVVQLKLPRTSGTFALLFDIYTALQQIAPAWVGGTEYPKNALVTYNGVVYQNTSGATIQSATTPDTSGSGWTAKPISELFLPLTGGTMTGALTVGHIPATAAELKESDPNGTTVLVLRENGNQLILSGTKIWWKRYDWQNGIDAFFPVASGTLALAAPSPTAGNLAALDASGNPTDSGVKAADKLDSTSAAPAFSTSSTYAVDKHVTYNGKLYRCTTAVTTAGAWDASKWTAEDMTTPDATLDVTTAKQLRVVAADGTVLWAQGYDLASTSSATLACDAVNNFTFAATSVSAFSDAATYAVDDRVTYGGKTYKCTTAVETAGAWTGSANWSEDPDVQAFTLPTAPTGKVGDFGLDIDNSANTVAVGMTLTGLDTAFSVVIPEGESLTDMLSIAAGELAQFYITLTTFRVNNLQTWHIVKQVVENGGAQP